MYAETPFMQQANNMGRYDFLRFSHLGATAGCFGISEIASGPIGGPGMAMAWTYAFLLRSLFKNQTLRKAALRLAA